MISASFDEESERDVLYPTIEASQARQLSSYLEGLVSDKLLSREIATVFNYLGDPILQKEGVALFRAGQFPLAWQIVRDLLKPSRRNLWSALSTGLSEWRPTTKVWRYGVVVLLSIMFLKMIDVSLKGLSALPPAEVASLRRNPTQPIHKVRSPVAVPRQAPRVRPATHEEIRQPPLHRKTLISEVPAGLVVSLLSKKSASVVWASLGNDYSYTIYAGDDAAMRNLVTVRGGIDGNRYILRWQNSTSKPRWLAVTSTDQNGHESSLSGAVKVP